MRLTVCLLAMVAYAAPPVVAPWSGTPILDRLVDEAVRKGRPVVAEDPFMICRSPEIDVLMDVTGSGGTVKRYEIHPDPNRLRRFGVTLRWPCGALASWWGNGPPRRRSVAGLRG